MTLAKGIVPAECRYGALLASARTSPKVSRQGRSAEHLWRHNHLATVIAVVAVMGFLLSRWLLERVQSAGEAALSCWLSESAARSSGERGAGVAQGAISCRGSGVLEVGGEGPRARAFWSMPSGSVWYDSHLALTSDRRGDRPLPRSLLAEAVSQGLDGSFSP